MQSWTSIRSKIVERTEVIEIGLYSEGVIGELMSEYLYSAILF